mmetsp:Transcript_55687/g.97219  ORF Transcript_55687/g.97219 Transcript_55687/m.97219 type:complete len:262 (-) Transcript_55687:153-938(-)
MRIPLARMEQGTIISKALHLELFPVQGHITPATTCTSDVKDTSLHQCQGVCIQIRHSKLLPIRIKLDLGVRLTSFSLDIGLALLGHVLGPFLLVNFAFVTRFNDKLCAKDICELRPVSISSSGDLSFTVIIVVTGQQMAKDELRYKHLVLLMNLDWQPLTIVPNLDSTLLCVDVHFDCVHLWVTLEIVCSIHEDLVKDLVEGWYIADPSVLHLSLLVVPHPKLVVLPLHGTNIGVWPEKNVLHLRLLLVCLLNRLIFPFVQ